MSARAHRLGVLSLFVVTVMLSVPAWSDVRAHLDRGKVYIGDPVTLVIESAGSSSGEPDLSPLNKDFRVLGTGTSSQFSFSNGRTSNRTTWTVQLGPLQSGKLQIPPIQVGAEKTQALELEVTDVPEQAAAQQSEHLFLEAEVGTSGNTYVQQQIPYTLRFYHDDTLLSGDLRPPPLQGALIRQIGDEARYAVNRNKRRYQVIERRYLIAPEKSGELLVPPASFSGQISTGQQAPRAQSRRDRLMQDFFRGSPFGGGGRSVRVFSKPLTIDVQPRPAGFAGAWLPAENLELHDSWASDPPEFRAGEPVSRTLTLRATGLSGAQIPSLKLDQPPGTRVYPDAPVNETRTDNGKVYGLSRQTFTYLPGHAGALTIPAVEVPWWNTQDDQQAVARLPEWVLQVEPGVAGTAPAPVIVPQPEERRSSASQSADRLESEVQDGRVTALPGTGLWPWLATALVACLLLIAWYMVTRGRVPVVRRVDSRPETPREPDDGPSPGIRDLLPLLQGACESGDARAAAQALLALGRACWPADPPRSLGQLAVRLGRGQEQIRMLDRVLYAAESTVWNGAELWDATRGVWSQGPARRKAAEEVVPPLYPRKG